jgi:hypothetical protein
LDPPLTGSIDTLILSGQVLIINGEHFTEAGEYFQNLTAANGCDSILTIHVKVLQTVIHYNLNDCVSHNNGDGTDMDYSEFTPLYPDPVSCASVTGSILFRDPPQGNKHSCTAGVNNSVAMCVSSLDNCTYDPGNERSVVFEITIVPAPDTAVQLTGITFFEQAPITFNWISGNSGPNNFPTLFGLRVLKNGVEIYHQENLPTSNAWKLETFDFLQHIQFIVQDPTVFRFELLPYCLVGNGATVAAWDLDEIDVSASCVPFIFTPIINGVVSTETGNALRNVEMQRSDDPSFQSDVTVETNQFGQYSFQHNEPGKHYYIKGYNNNDFKNGVSTLDLIHIQRHLLGIKSIDSPYQLIAADANRNGRISVTDLLELRKLILGVYDVLPNNTSWRFGNAQPELIHLYPWGFNETIDIEALEKDVNHADFTGVKIGDVNGDVKTHLTSSEVSKRNNSKFQLSIAEKLIKHDEPEKIEIKARNNYELAGLQFALQCSGSHVEQIISGVLEIEDDQYVFTDGMLHLSWIANESVDIAAGDVLFTIVLSSKHTGPLSALLHLTDDILSPEAYIGNDLEKYDLELSFNSGNDQDQNTLFPSEPNPFTSSTMIRFQLEHAGTASLRFYDMAGHLLSEIRRPFDAGMNEIEISNQDLNLDEGVILYQLQGDGFIAVQRMVLMK